MHIDNGVKEELYNEPYSHYMRMISWCCFARNAFSRTQKTDTHLHLKYLSMAKKRRRKIYLNRRFVAHPTL